MKLSQIVLALLLVGTSAVFAQEKQVTLEEIWNGEFSQQRLESLNSLNNGDEYIVLNQDRASGTSSIDVYSYKSGEKERSLVNSANLQDINRFSSYQLSDNEGKVLLGTEMEQIYRHSSRGIFYVYDLSSKSLKKLTDRKIQEPTFSPDGSKVAYVFENNIYIQDLASGKETQVTNDGKINENINGVTDWVYEEEFAFVRAFDFNKDGSKLAFLKFDEREVPEFSMDMFGTDLYPTTTTFKYPKAGEANSKVSLHVYNLQSEETNDVKLGDYKDFYIPRIKWTNNADVLSAQVSKSSSK